MTSRRRQIEERVDSGKENDVGTLAIMVRRSVATHPIHRSVFLVAVCVMFARGPVLAAGTDPDWPCVQRLVPQVSAGMVWAGPPLEGAPDWRLDNAISDLAGRLADRRVPMGEAESLIETFAASQDVEKDQRLTMLFAGILDKINSERSSVINGIERYARRQQALAERIESTLAEIDALPRQGGSPDQEARRTELGEQNAWDSRIYEEREHSLTYLCESPILLEQRVFALARTIQNLLD